MSTAANSAPTAFQVLRLQQVRNVTGLCRSMIYQLEAEHRFPTRIKIGTRAVGWIESEIHEWVAKRIESSRSNITGQS